jgi:hypothetical protein
MALPKHCTALHDRAIAPFLATAKSGIREDAQCVAFRGSASQHRNDRGTRGLQVPKVRKAFFPAFDLMCAAFIGKCIQNSCRINYWISSSRVGRRPVGNSCVDGPRLARDHLACSAEVACSHVSRLLVQSGWTAGPDGVREPSPHHSNGIDVPMKRQVWLGCAGIDRLCVAQRPKPPPPRAGSSHAGASPPRRCARSCWLALPPPPGSAAAGAGRSPTALRSVNRNQIKTHT